MSQPIKMPEDSIERDLVHIMVLDPDDSKVVENFPASTRDAVKTWIAEGYTRDSIAAVMCGDASNLVKSKP